MGVISHIGSFWRFRFPSSASLEMDASEFADMLGEFDSSLTQDRPR
jgi:hypothetical protein